MPRALSVWTLCDACAGNISGGPSFSVKHYVGTTKPPPLALHHGVNARESAHHSLGGTWCWGEEKPAACWSALEPYQLVCKLLNLSPVQHHQVRIGVQGMISHQSALTSKLVELEHLP